MILNCLQSEAGFQNALRLNLREALRRVERKSYLEPGDVCPSAPLVLGEREIPGRRMCGFEMRTQNKGPFNPRADMSLESLNKLSVWSLTCSQAVGLRIL